MNEDEPTSSGGAEGSTTKLIVQSLSQGQVTPVRQRGLHQTIRHAKILPSVRERGVCHSNREPVERVVNAPVKVEAHLVQPRECAVVNDILLDKLTRDITLVDEFGDEVLALAARYRFELRQHNVRKKIKALPHGVEWTVQRLRAL